MKEIVKRIIVVCVIFLIAIFAPIVNHAQQGVVVRSGFLEDSLRIGDPVHYYLAVNYPANLTVLLPDSTFEFTPFEFLGKRYTTTSTIDNISYDSVVYRLTTFEIDEIQHLQLPAFIVMAKDCTEIISNGDSILLQQFVTTPPPDTVDAANLPLKTNTVYEQVSYLINYPLMLIIVGVLVVLVIILWLVFGNKIRKHFRVRRLTRDHHQFMISYQSHTDSLRETFIKQHAEAALILWKKYLEGLSDKPFTKMTTPEILLMEEDIVMGEHLRVIDRAIYGPHTNVYEPMNALQRIAEERFHKKLEEVKNG